MADKYSRLYIEVHMNTMIKLLKEELEIINTRIRAMLDSGRSMDDHGTTVYDLLEIKEHILTGIIHLYEVEANEKQQPKLKLVA